MSIESEVKRRGIERVVHFTTNVGFIGVCDSRLVKARSLLGEDDRLEHILKYNASDRSRDREWHDYVNLSISDINHEFFRWSKGNHDDVFWMCLEFSPEILSHEGVLFTTTNNIYTGVKRNPGLDGFTDMFADRVERWNGNIIKRKSGEAENRTTDYFAEVLYPKQVSLDYLIRITPQHVENYSEIMSIAYGCGVEGLEVSQDPSSIKWG
ncbi:MAG: DarT ssDNA thymidine ADP-ribosyltransferase family protein [Flavobacteriaceae bacterium]